MLRLQDARIARPAGKPLRAALVTRIVAPAPMCIEFRQNPWLLFLLLSAVGCQRQSEEISQVDTNLSWLGSLYGMYVGHNKGHTPQSVEEFRKYVEKSVSAEELARLNVSDVNELFVSPRDGKPFQIVFYTVLPAPVPGEPPPVVLYEAEGEDGQREIAYLGGGTQAVDENELQKLLPTTPANKR